MKRFSFLLIIVSMTLITGCSQKNATNVAAEGLNLTHLDTTASPGADFYRFATGGWQDANPIPDEFSRYGSFDKLRENNQKQLQDLIEALGKQENTTGSNAQKVGDLYTMGLDSVKLNANGATPIKPFLEEINAAANKDDIIGLMAKVNKYASSPFFGFYVGPDDKNSSRNIAHLYQSGIGLGDRDYYLLTDDHSKMLRDGYIDLIEKQFQNAGYTEADAKNAATDIMKIETQLAKTHVTKEMRRLPELNYHKMTTDDLNSKVADFNWSLYFTELGAGGIDSLNVSQIEPVQKAIALIESEPMQSLKNYLSWQVINSAAGYLSDDFVNTNFEFYGKLMSGTKELRPRWKRSIDAVNGALGEAVGQLYVDKYFSADAKVRMLDLVENLRVSLGERINNLEWMSAETRVKAHEKLNSFTVKIGYPDKWKDYSTLDVKDDSYWANAMRASDYNYNEMISELGKPVDKTKWFMTPQTVNAYYNPSSNEICFPAGILQTPFFYISGDDAINYGGIGVVIGHEMTHGFDDQGRKFDKDGNLTDWWTKEDADRFDERAKVLVNHFDNIEVLDTVRANGTFTLGENIADQGGLQIAYTAFMKTPQAQSEDKIDGLTAAQRFFVSYANLWAGNIRDAEILRLTKIDPHSLGKWRVNGAVSHVGAWYDAFNVEPSNEMYIPVEERVSIW